MDNDSTVTITTADKWSLIYFVEPGLSELYRLSTDPKQEKNIITQHPEIAHELHKMLVNFMNETKVAPHLANRRAELRL